MKKLFLTGSLIFALFIGCNEDKLELKNYGSVTGTVLDGETYKPVEGVLVTTTPPSISLLTDVKGQFTIPRVLEGDVAINTKKKDYLSNSLAVEIVDGESTDLQILVFKDDDNIGTISLYDPVPGNGAVDQVTSILLKWKLDGKNTTANFTYNIYMFEANSTVQKLVGEDITIPEVMVSGLNNSTTYFWYVVVKYNNNKIAFSPTWSFKTKGS
jgi:hypothetical protein